MGWDDVVSISIDFSLPLFHTHTLSIFLEIYLSLSRRMLEIALALTTIAHPHPGSEQRSPPHRGTDSISLPLIVEPFLPSSTPAKPNPHPKVPDLKPHDEHQAVADRDDDRERQERTRDPAREEMLHLQVAQPRLGVFHHDRRYHEHRHRSAIHTRIIRGGRSSR